jgi:hypothetical protein
MSAGRQRNGVELEIRLARSRSARQFSVSSIERTVPMHRRVLLRVLGAAAIPPLLGLDPDGLFALAGTVRRGGGRGVRRALSAAQARLVGEIADVILPRTDSPAATEVGVTEFVDLLLGEWYPAEQRDGLLRGIDEIDRMARAEGAPFGSLAEDRRAALATRLDQAADRPPGSAAAAFRQLKGLAIYGYFTSERVMKDVLHNPIVPGRFGGCEHV